MIRLKYPVLLTAGLMALSFATVKAEEAKKPAPLSLQDCIDIAMRDQTDILVAQNSVTAAKSRYSRAASSYLPSISIQNNAFTWGSKGVLTTSRTGTALTVNQNIFDGGLREANAKEARYGITESSSSLLRTTETVAFNVTNDYYEALRARHLAEVAESSVKYNEGLRELVQTRANVGDAAKVDVLPVEAELANARVSLLSAKNNVRTALIQLQNTMGISPKSDFDIEDINGAPDTQVQPMESYLKAAVESRPDVEGTEAGLGAAKAAVRAARLSLYPRPVISGEYQKGFGTSISSSTQVVGGIVFDIFNGGANRAAFKEAKANQASAELQAKQVVKDIEAQVQEAYLNLTSSKERLTASDVGFEAAQKNYEVQSEKYKQGLAIPLDLLNAEVQVVTAQSNQVQARYDYYIALAQLQYAVGKQGGLNEKG